MSQEASIEEVFNELQTTLEGRQQLELATLRAIIKSQQALIQELKGPPTENEQPD